MKLGEETAAICGLFCGTCPSYPNYCSGCLSNNVASGCDVCGNGFRECAQKHNITRCHECYDFPCKKIEAFSKQHIVNGICHHENVLTDCCRMEKIGVVQWVDEQVQANTCKNCGKIKPWHEHSCPYCK